ncbi:uncharacterized protein LOC100661405 isoform X3 [Loxodonta africana]|uniref:uncharacterized protein LOC100661405 isoform X3 n=1 Tax=Loxodonta africana TaxID=9785 RepID=UPI0030D592A9
MMGAEAARPARNSPRTLFWLRQVQLLLQLLLPLTEAALWPGEAPSAAPPVKERLLLAPSQAPGGLRDIDQANPMPQRITRFCWEIHNCTKKLSTPGRCP